jgi:hypothetical protein
MEVPQFASGAQILFFPLRMLFNAVRAERVFQSLCVVFPACTLLYNGYAR